MLLFMLKPSCSNRSPSIMPPDLSLMAKLVIKVFLTKQLGKWTIWIGGDFTSSFADDEDFKSGAETHPKTNGCWCRWNNRSKKVTRVKITGVLSRKNHRFCTGYWNICAIRASMKLKFNFFVTKCIPSPCINSTNTPLGIMQKSDGVKTDNRKNSGGIILWQRTK